MKTALVTGAGRGIGREVARQLIAAGYSVFGGVRDKERSRADWAHLPQGPGRIEAVELDVNDPASIAAAAKVLPVRTPHLDVLINNAGIVGTRPSPGEPWPVGAIREVFETNFFGVIGVTQAFLPLLRLSSEPRIVNVTSGLGSLTRQSDQEWEFYAFKSAYFPSKTALNAYTIWLAYELREGPFKVNAVDPGYTATEFNNYRGTGKVEDAAAVIVKYATLRSDGPTGGFFDREGPVPW
jgi:NAD(P)-dependent dehydrogenase (short-subunit alcohol dehydrogenase family)